MKLSGIVYPSQVEEENTPTTNYALATGENGAGQAGVGWSQRVAPYSILEPLACIELTNIVSMQCSFKLSVAKLSDKTLRTVGGASDGQLGTGNQLGRCHWQDPGLTDVETFAVGGAHVIALAAGKLWGWGGNNHGEVGNGEGGEGERSIHEPVEVLDCPSGVVEVAAGIGVSYARTSSGEIYRWGKPSGEAEYKVPTRVLEGVAGITQMSCSEDHLVVLKSNGTVWAMGSNTYGQLGNNSTVSSHGALVQCTGVSTASAVGAGGYHTAVLLSNGEVLTCGRNNVGQLGNGEEGGSAPSKLVLESVLTGASHLSVGRYYNLAKVGSGIKGWGLNGSTFNGPAGIEGSGQLGDGTAKNKPSPVAMNISGSIAGFAAGEQHSVIWLSSGSIPAAKTYLTAGTGSLTAFWEDTQEARVEWRVYLPSKENEDFKNSGTLPAGTTEHTVSGLESGVVYEVAVNGNLSSDTNSFGKRLMEGTPT